MTRTPLFLSNRTQAVRLPKSVAFPEDVREVTIVVDGCRRIITPAGRSWDDFFAEPGVELGPRHQPPEQDREAF